MYEHPPPPMWVDGCLPPAGGALMDTCAVPEAAPPRGGEPERTRRNGLDIHGFLVAQTHDRALAEGPFNIAKRRFESFLLVHAGFLVHELQRWSASHLEQH